MADYVKTKHDIGFLKQDGSTKVGLRLARDKNGNPIYRTYDDEYLANQFFTGTPGYGNLPPEKEIAIRQDDWRSGFGLETYDATEPKRYFSSFGMDMRHRGMGILSNGATQATLPSLLAITDGALELWDDANTLTNWTKTGAGTLSQETSSQHGGTYAAKIDCTGVALGFIYQDAATWTTAFQSTTITVTAWLKTGGGADVARLRVNDGVGNTAVTTSSATWVKKTVTRKLDGSATQCRIELETSAGDEGWFDDVIISTSGPILAFADFNGHLYFANGACLEKVTLSTGAISFVAGFQTTIKDLEVFNDGTNDRLYISLGEQSGNFYYYMSTAEVLTETDSLAHFFKAVGTTMWCARQWNSVHSATDPTADANWSGATTVGGKDYYINELLTDFTTLVIKKQDRTYYIDSSGNVQILIGATKHFASATVDYRQAAEWQEKYYIGAGTQSLIEYDAGTITWRSPSKWCTNLSEFVGQVMGIAGDEEYLFIAVDNSSKIEIMAGRLETIDSTTSWVWHPLNEITLAGCEALHVSSVYQKRLWVASTDSNVLYYIPLPTGYGDVENDTNRNFATNGYFVTPRLHGNFRADDKAFIKVTVELGHTYDADIYFECHYKKLEDTSWTDAGDLKGTATNRKPSLFIPADGSSNNPVSETIQFKFVGKTDDTTKTPILKSYDCRAILYPSNRRIIECEVLCDDEITLKDGTIEKGQAATIKAALEEARDATWPVTIYPFGWEGSGDTIYAKFLPLQTAITKKEKGRGVERHYLLRLQEVSLS